MRDFWIYQDREIQEPWAIHVFIWNDETMSARMYAEYLSGKRSTVTKIRVSLVVLLDCVEAILLNADRPECFNKDDEAQIRDYWLEHIAPLVKQYA